MRTNWVKQSNNPIRIPNKFLGILTALKSSVFIVCRNVEIQRFECINDTLDDFDQREKICSILCFAVGILDG